MELIELWGCDKSHKKIQRDILWKCFRDIRLHHRCPVNESTRKNQIANNHFKVCLKICLILSKEEVFFIKEKEKRDGKCKRKYETEYWILKTKEQKKIFNQILNFSYCQMIFLFLLFLIFLFIFNLVLLFQKFFYDICCAACQWKRQK